MTGLAFRVSFALLLVFLATGCVHTLPGKWVERFGGMFRADLSTGKLIWAALGTDEANLVDLVAFGRGNLFFVGIFWRMKFRSSN